MQGLKSAQGLHEPIALGIELSPAHVNHGIDQRRHRGRHRRMRSAGLEEHTGGVCWCYRVETGVRGLRVEVFGVDGVAGGDNGSAKEKHQHQRGKCELVVLESRAIGGPNGHA